MKNTLILLITAAFFQDSIGSRSTTLNVETRIENLKGQLRAEIERKQGTNSASYDGDESEEEDSRQRDFFIQPIVSRERKRHRHMRPITNVTVKPTVKFPTKTRRKTTTCKGHKSKSQMRSELKGQRTTKMGIYMINPLDIFYRRAIEENTGDVERKWAHCQDMITPYLKGIKKEPQVLKKVTARDPVAQRLFQLLNVNTTDYTKEDVFSVLFQISKLHIRLFQWDVMPIRILLNILIKGPFHTFRNLKHGVKKMFADWRLTLDNTTNLLHNTRIVRPPCTVTSRYSGTYPIHLADWLIQCYPVDYSAFCSTKAQKVSKLKEWTAKPTTPCDYDDGICEDRK